LGLLICFSICLCTSPPLPWVSSSRVPIFFCHRANFPFSPRPISAPVPRPEFPHLQPETVQTTPPPAPPIPFMVRLSALRIIRFPLTLSPDFSPPLTPPPFSFTFFLFFLCSTLFLESPLAPPFLKVSFQIVLVSNFQTTPFQWFPPGCWFLFFSFFFGFDYSRPFFDSFFPSSPF